MQRHLLGLLSALPSTAPQPGWAASSKDYAGPCANESHGAGLTPVPVRRRPHRDRRILAPSTSPRPAASGWGYPASTPTSRSPGSAMARWCSSTGATSTASAGTTPLTCLPAPTRQRPRPSKSASRATRRSRVMERWIPTRTSATAGPIRRSIAPLPGSPLPRRPRRSLHRPPPRSIATRRTSTWPSTRAFAPRIPARHASPSSRTATWWCTTSGERRAGRRTRPAGRVAWPGFRAMAMSWSSPRPAADLGEQHRFRGSPNVNYLCVQGGRRTSSCTKWPRAVMGDQHRPLTRTRSRGAAPRISVTSSGSGCGKH